MEESLIKYRQHKNNKVGSKKKSDELRSLDEIRKLFIEVKKEHFKVFIENENKFKSENVKKDRIFLKILSFYLFSLFSFIFLSYE